MSRRNVSKWVWALAVVAAGTVYTLTKERGILPSSQAQGTEQRGVERPSNDQRNEDGMELPATPSDCQWQILKREGYTVAYDKAAKLPRWVAWHLTASHTSGEFNRDGLKFVDDNDVPKPRATDADYTGSGYDHGHMCPSGDNKWSRKAQVQTFLYTNCCPQVHGLNSGDWNDIEQRCRLWAKTFGEIYIVCGPILDNCVTHKTIGQNGVAVPEKFFKVVLCVGDKRSATKAIGFICENTPRKHSMADLVCTVDEVEEITHLDFFPQLPDDTENEVESTASLRDWTKAAKTRSQ